MAEWSGVLSCMLMIYALGLSVFLGSMSLFSLQQSAKGLTMDNRHDTTAGGRSTMENIVAFWCHPLGPGFRRKGHPFSENRGYCPCH